MNMVNREIAALLFDCPSTDPTTASLIFDNRFVIFEAKPIGPFEVRVAAFSGGGL